jgi:hypothetical protein
MEGSAAELLGRYEKDLIFFVVARKDVPIQSATPGTPAQSAANDSRKAAA